MPVRSYRKSEYYNENGLIFFSHFNKAFDSLDHAFMRNSLAKFGFNSAIINWINLFYKDAKSCITNNGHFSEYFNIQKGVRQGCPLSPYIFIICIELLANEINTNENISGIRVKNTEIKQTLFADDACFLLDGSRLSFETLIATLDNFSKISGLRLNKNKCTVLRIGRMKFSNIIFCKKHNFSWTSESAKTLGITFLNNTDEMTEYNIKPKIKEFKNCLAKWQKWKLSLMGKITVLKTFAFPKLIYPLTVLNNPGNEIIKDIKNSMFSFLWDNKPDKIARNKIVQNYKNGGLKMIDLENFIDALKSSWVKRMLYQPTTKWAKIYSDMLENNGNLFIFKCNLKSSNIDSLELKSKFLTECLKGWCRANYKEKQTIIGKEILWNNSNIFLLNKTLFYKTWFDRGITQIEHIFNYRNKHFHTFTELQELYDLPRSDFLKYHTLVGCIPKCWKEKINNEERSYVPPSYLINRITPTTKICKFINELLIENTHIKNNKQEHKWEMLFNKQLHWESIFTNYIQITIDSSLRTFQYKYMMNIVPNNENLFKYGIVESSLCDLCSMSVETNMHLFWNCPNVHIFWNNIETYIKSQLSICTDFKLSYECISLCNTFINNRNCSNCINFIVLLGKYFIFKCKYQRCPPIFQRFLEYFKYKIKIEEIIASWKGKTEKHTQKWNNFVI